MMILSNLIFYIFSASCVFVYGIGIKDLILYLDNSKNLVLYFLKTFFTTIFTVGFTWIFTTYVLSPIGISDIFPFFLIFICLTFSILFSFLCKLVFKEEINEYILSFFLSFLAINEGTRFLDAILIAVISSVAMYVLIPVIYSIKRRINSSSAHLDLKNGVLILVSIGLLLITLFVHNISWLGFEVL